jgi:hypothetical protein
MANKAEDDKNAELDEISIEEFKQIKICHEVFDKFINFKMYLNFFRTFCR